MVGHSGSVNKYLTNGRVSGYTEHGQMDGNVNRGVSGSMSEGIIGRMDVEKEQALK